MLFHLLKLGVPIMKLLRFWLCFCSVSSRPINVGVNKIFVGQILPSCG